MPRYPGPDVVPLARLPAPPLLNPDDSLELRAWECACAYRTVVASVYGWCGALPQVPKRTWVATPAVTRAAKLLTELRRPPIAWCAFSVGVWLAYHGKYAQNKRARMQQPPLQWVYAQSRVQQHESWYAWERGKLVSGRVLVVPAQRELLTRYEDMRAAVLALPAPFVQQDLERAISATLGRTLYERLVRTACAQVQERLEDLDDRVQRGEYIW